MLITGGYGAVSTESSQTLGMHGVDDDFYFAIKNTQAMVPTYIETGKISLDCENPVLSLYVYRLSGQNGETDLNTTDIYAIVDGEMINLKSFCHDQLKKVDDWNRIIIPLTQYKGKNVRIRVSGEARIFSYNLYDDIMVYDGISDDLSVSMSIPQTVKTGKEFQIKAVVVNEGVNPAESYTVSLWRNGEEFDMKQNEEALAPGENNAFVFTDVADITDDKTIGYKIVVNLTNDKKTDNNESSATVTRTVPGYPGVTGLTGKETAEGNSVNWDAIEIPERNEESVTDDIETATPWEDEYDDWTFIDVDNATIGGFQGLEIPNHKAGEDKASFFVFDSKIEGGGQSFQAHSGDRYLASLFRYDEGQVDDWAISPDLPGIAQTVTFWAKSYSSRYPEKLSMYYSLTDSDDTADFTLVKEEANIPYDWTKYSFDIPAGARHFAIRSHAEGGFMLLLDDFTFTRLVGFGGILQGYNLYCDGNKLNSTPIAANSFLHENPGIGEHSYRATAVYDLGESEFSEPFVINTTSVSDILDGNGNPMARALKGEIIVTGADSESVAIVSADGTILHRGVGNTRFKATPGVYIVTIGDNVFKLAVR